MFDRLIALIGEENFNKIQKSKVLLVGVGGVGTYALESLVRNGFINITIIDFDNIDITNLNRQLITNQNNIGLSKVDEAKKRYETINPNVKINALQLKINEENIKDYLDYDYIIDACDDVTVKFLLMKYSIKYDYKLISSMGTAKKNHPELLRITTLDKTEYDPLARILRQKIRKEHINKKMVVVSSNEKPIESKILASNNLVPSTAGLLITSYIYNDIVKDV